MKSSAMAQRSPSHPLPQLFTRNHAHYQPTRVQRSPSRQALPDNGGWLQPGNNDVSNDHRPARYCREKTPPPAPKSDLLCPTITIPLGTASIRASLLGTIEPGVSNDHRPARYCQVLVEGVNIVDIPVSNDHRSAIHCRGGRHRTGDSQLGCPTITIPPSTTGCLTAACVASAPSGVQRSPSRHPLPGCKRFSPRGE